MSNPVNESIFESIYEDIEEELNHGTLSREINEIAHNRNLHADDHLDVILEIIAEERFESRSL
tara:strand:- start:607 stop:795 length:189 start_codon:yes stop_codon:yes gene_type:complete